MQKITFVPAVLPKHIDEIHSLVTRVGNSAKVIQIDICDGSYVEARTWPYVGPTLPTFNDDFELPGWEIFDFEFDLMIRNPELHIENLKNCGPSKVVLHVESSSLEGIVQAAEKLSLYDIEVGLAIQNDVDFEKVRTLYTILSQKNIHIYFQVMGIDTIGKQGEPFSPKTISTVEKVHAEYPEILIQIDGAVNETSARKLVEAGATSLVLGSYLSRSGESVDEKIKYLKSLIY
jgi:ribulose-phosphate 3-epimerase